jgi:ABC-type spermidine/putrescine transport system permease subunit II
MASAVLAHAQLAAQREARLTRIATRATLIVATAITFCIYGPVLWLMVLSVSADPLSGLPGPLTSTWYQSLFSDQRWLEPLKHSLQIAAIVSVLCMTAAAAVGRVLPRMRKGAGPLLAAFLLPLVVPGVVIGLDIFIFYRMFLGLKMGMWSLVMVHFIWAFPFALIGVLVVSSRFDVRLLEAAADLGAGPWRRFWDIERPLLAAGVTTAGMFGFLLSLTELPRSIFVFGHTQTLPLFTWAETTARGSHVPLIYCLNSLIAGVSVVMSVLCVRLLRRRVQET